MGAEHFITANCFKNICQNNCAENAILCLCTCCCCVPCFYCCCEKDLIRQTGPPKKIIVVNPKDTIKIKKEEEWIDLTEN
jgi:hypothetical protein